VLASNAHPFATAVETFPLHHPGRVVLTLLAELNVRYGMYMDEATVVAFYGEKDEGLASMILEIQNFASEEFGVNFTPKPIREVHATIIGLGEISIIGRRKSEKDAAIEVHPVELFRYICSFFRTAPTVVQFGGFQDCDYPIQSRGRRLYERSFVIHDNALVLIGWTLSEPIEGAPPSDTIDRLRRNCQSFGFRHKYHDTPAVIDPDLYMVIGDIERHSPEFVRRCIPSFIARFREYLASSRPILVPLGVNQLDVILYRERSLPFPSSLAIPVCEMTDADEIARIIKSYSSPISLT